MFQFTKDKVRNVGERVKSTFDGRLRFENVAIAFQPIIDTAAGKVWGYEALTRGTDGRSYPAIVADMSEKKRMSFDKMVVMKALHEAARLGLTSRGSKISINVRPTVDRAAVDAAFVARAARHCKIPLDLIVLELTEDAKLTCDEYQKVVELHRKYNIATAIDDFGSGYSGLNVLAICGAAVVKLDRQLVYNIDKDASKQLIVESFLALCTKLGSVVVAEGVETQAEAVTLRALGVRIMQGYYFGKPAIGGPAVLRLFVDENEARREWVAPAKSTWRSIFHNSGHVKIPVTLLKGDHSLIDLINKH